MATREDVHFGKCRVEQLLARLKQGKSWERVDKKLLSWASRNYFFEDFKALPTSQSILGDVTGGSTGDENHVILGPNLFHNHVMGTQTITIPQSNALGLDIAHDLTDNDGMEYTNGITATAAKRVFTVGTDPSIFFRVNFSIADVSGTDDCAVGFRKAEAFQANIDDYDEMACLNVISGNITIETILNGGDTGVTDTTDNWGDGETHTLEVRVTKAGVVTYLIDDNAPTVTAAFTFDATEVIVPFFYFLHATTSPGAIILKEWEWGYL